MHFKLSFNEERSAKEINEDDYIKSIRYEEHNIPQQSDSFSQRKNSS